VFLNVGSGNTMLDPRLINLDSTGYEGVDFVCDAADLPIEDGSVDVVLNVSLLEHVPDPARVLGEIRRVLRPGGIVYTDVPFLVGYHASPGDYTRWTHEGVLALHRDFDTVALVLNGGPTSALLWVLQEWIALTLSFGSRRLHTAVYVAAMLVTFPLKFLDVALKRLPHARHISSCFIYIGRKPAPPA
jgi:SAM-dependent methyltransferase